MKIISRSINGYDRKIARLNRDTLKNVKFETNTVSGSISLDKPKLLCMSIPYSKGWSMYIDGVKTEARKVNYMYMGALIPEGSHEVLLVYRTPGLRLGAVLTAVGVLSLIGWCTAELFIKKRKQEG